MGKPKKAKIASAGKGKEIVTKSDPNFVRYVYKRHGLTILSDGKPEPKLGEPSYIDRFPVKYIGAVKAADYIAQGEADEKARLKYIEDNKPAIEAHAEAHPGECYTLPDGDCVAPVCDIHDQKPTVV